MDVTAAMLLLSLYGIILLHFLLFCDCIGALFLMTVMQYISAWCYFWSVIECYLYSLWHHINLKIVPVSLNGPFVFWIYTVITDDKSALVRQMAWYRQSTNHYLITWTNVDDASWHHIASLGLNRLTNCGLVTPCNDIDLGKSCLTAPSHYLNQCWPQKIPQPLANTNLLFCSTLGANVERTSIFSETDPLLSVPTGVLTYPRPSRWLAHCLLINERASNVVSVNSLKPGAWKCISLVWKLHLKNMHICIFICDVNLGFQ